MAASPWVSNVADLLRRPGTRRRHRVDAPMRDLAVTGSRVPAEAIVHLDAELESISDDVLATGEVWTEWRGECVRCLRPAGGEVRAGFRELYEQGPGGEGTYPLTGAEVDLEPLAREHVLLELPLLPYCREDCAGLCPSCGADLNEGPCGCLPDERDPRWAALDALRPEGEGAT